MTLSQAHLPPTNTSNIILITIIKTYFPWRSPPQGRARPRIRESGTLQKLTRSSTRALFNQIMFSTKTRHSRGRGWMEILQNWTNTTYLVINSISSTTNKRNNRINHSKVAFSILIWTSWRSQISTTTRQYNNSTTSTLTSLTSTISLRNLYSLRGLNRTSFR